MTNSPVTWAEVVKDVAFVAWLKEERGIDAYTESEGHISDIYAAWNRCTPDVASLTVQEREPAGYVVEFGHGGNWHFHGFRKLREDADADVAEAAHSSNVLCPRRAVPVYFHSPAPTLSDEQCDTILDVFHTVHGREIMRDRIRAALSAPFGRNRDGTPKHSVHCSIHDHCDFGCDCGTTEIKAALSASSPTPEVKS